MFYTKSNKSQNYSQLWQQALRNKQIAKNSYRAFGDIKKAKSFVQSVSNYTPQAFIDHLNEIVVFSLDTFADVPLLQINY